MKKIICLLVSFIVVISLTIITHADETLGYKEEIYSDIQKIRLPDEADSLGIDLSDPEAVTDIDSKGVFDYILSAIKSSILAPLKIFLIIAALSLISQIISSLTDNSESYEIMLVIIAFISISGSVIKSLSDSISAINSIQAFMAAYVPIFASILVASGNVSGAISYHSIVLYACEAVTLFATLILKPILVCISVMSVTQAINSEIPDFTSSLRKAFTTMIGLAMTVFTGVIGLQATVGRAADGLGLRAGKYLVSSFVPILGYTITQSYQTIKSSLSMIRSTIGAFGIVIVAVVFILPLISIAVYRCFFTFSEWVASLCQSKKIASLMKGLNDVYSLLSVILLMYFLMLIISTGMLIALGGSA